MKAIKSRLSIMLFLEFAVWGAYLTSMGSFLFNVGLKNEIGWFYAVQGIVSIFMPALIGILADRWLPAQKMLSLCHVIAGAFMIGTGWYALNHGSAVPFTMLFTLYTISVAFFMPTIGLSNSVAYSIMDRAGLDTVKHFPPLRTLGTVGFIVSMLITNFAGFQNNCYQFFSSGIFSFLLAIYSLSLPNCPITARKKGEKKGGIAEALGLKAFSLFKDKQMAIFFIFSMLLGVSLQITNGFANPFIQSFGNVEPYKSMNLWAVDNANALISLSQISETLCILLIPFFLKRFGIKVVMLMSMLAWVFRFGFFGLGSPAFPGVILFILSMIVYGIAFDFFNVSGSLYVNEKTHPSIRSSAQGLFMLMTNGLGATIGVLSAQAVINHFVYRYTTIVNDQTVITDPAAYINGWHTSWYIFAAYALVVGVLFFFCFSNPRKQPSETVIEKSETSDAEDAGGMVETSK